MDLLDKESSQVEGDDAILVDTLPVPSTAPKATITTITETTSRQKPKKSVEGWIVFATGIPAEAETDDVERIFSEYGSIHSIHLNVDRRTGYLKGYALVEYEQFKSAQDAILGLNDTLILDQKIRVDWCFLDRK